MEEVSGKGRSLPAVSAVGDGGNVVACHFRASASRQRYEKISYRFASSSYRFFIISLTGRTMLLNGFVVSNTSFKIFLEM